MALFTIENVYAENVDLLANDYVAGIVSPSAFLGLAGSMQMKLCKGSPYKVAVLPIFHEIDPTGGRTLGEMRHSDQAAGDANLVVEIPQDMPAVVRCSLVIELQDGDATEIEVQRFIENARIAGGAVTSDPVAPRRRVIVRRFDSWGDIAMRRLPRGYAVMPLAGPIAAGSEGETLDLLVAKEAARQEGMIPNIIPAGLRRMGFGARNLQGARDGKTPHEFAEPVNGLCTTVSVRSKFFHGMSADDLRAHAWAWSVAPGCPLALFAPAYRNSSPDRISK